LSPIKVFPLSFKINESGKIFFAWQNSGKSFFPSHIPTKKRISTFLNTIGKIMTVLHLAKIGLNGKDFVIHLDETFDLRK